MSLSNYYKNSIAGYFIIEGVDGCGKTDCIARVKQKYEAIDVPVETIKEPGNFPIGEYLRRYIATGDGDAYELLHLFLAARRETALQLHARSGYGAQGYYQKEGECRPAALISDRGFPSTFVFQAPELATIHSHLEEIHEQIWREHEAYIFPLAYPNAVIFLDVTKEEALNRCRQRIMGGAAMHSFDTLELDVIHERINYYERTLNFLISKGVEVIRIPAQGTREEVAEATFQALSFLFQPRNYS